MSAVYTLPKPYAKVYTLAGSRPNRPGHDYYKFIPLLRHFCCRTAFSVLFFLCSIQGNAPVRLSFRV
jgi:hypothetical protein